MSEFGLIAVSAIFSSNIVASSCVGAVSLQSEKRNFGFMIFTAFLTILSIILTGLVYFLLEKYLLVQLEAEFLKLFIVVCFACIFAFISKSIIKAVNKEDYYFYEKSYQLPVQTAVTVGTVMIIDFSAKFVTTLYVLAMYSAGFLLVQLIFYGLYERVDNNNTLKPARNVPSMLLILSVVSMILYAVSMCF